MIIDFDKVKRAMDALAGGGRGSEALDYFSRALDEFQSKIGVDLNPAEFRYVVERLAAQRIPHLAAETRVTPREIEFRQLPHGFVIKTEPV